MATSEKNVDSESVEEMGLKQCDIGESTAVEKTRPTYGFDEKKRTTDFTLSFGDRSLYVSKVVLEIVSPVFEKMFNGHMTESVEMEIDGKNYYDFAEFLACIYPGNLLKVSNENVYRVLPLAIDYEIENLKNMCESVLIESLETDNSDTNLFRCMEVAYKYDIKDLKAKCLNQAISIYKKDTSRTDELVKMKNRLKDDIWDVIYTTLRTDASKFKFWFAALRYTDNLNFNFQNNYTDSKYVTMNYKLKWNDLVKDTVVLPALWSFSDILMTISREKPIGFTRQIHFSLHLRNEKDKVECRVAVVIEFVNTIPCKRLYRGPYRGDMNISESPSHCLTINENEFARESDGFVIDGQFEFRIHLLVNRPVC